MASALKANGLPDRVLENVEINHNPECYLGALDAVLRFNSYPAGALIDHQLGFCYWPASAAVANLSVSAFARGETESMIKNVSGISIQWVSDRTWDDLIIASAAALSRGQPFVVLVDTFFLTQFPKRKGHTPHAVLVYGFDAITGNFLLKSAVPDDWRMQVIDMRPACQSAHIAGSSPITWIDFNFPNVRQSPSVQSLLLNSLANMSGGNRMQAGLTGVPGLKRFAEDFSHICHSPLTDIRQFCHGIGRMVPTIAHQRQRFAAFARTAFGDTDELCRAYSRLSIQWEIFANTCLKLGFVDAPNLRDKLTSRLELLAIEEEKTLVVLEERSHSPKIECVLEP